MQSATNTACA